jgi:phosphohistidine swiveling domain-containing protein
MSVIRWPEDDAPVTAIGGKAFALAALGRGGFDVPAWFAVSSDASTAGLAAIADDVAAAVSRLVPDGALVAVRSSAIDEDGAGHSFAGQFESYLNVPPPEVLARVREVWQSADAERVQAYRRERGLEGPPVAPAVIVQRMAVPEAAGVAFSADPVSGRRTVAVVAAVPGLGDTLVSGDADAGAYEVTPSGVVTLRSRREGAATSVLTDAQAAAVAALARKCEQHFGRPQDIEWALEHERVLLLQSRPITTLATLADPDGTRRIWDNSNIAESYGGITTPLTFSFARTVYAEVYRQFCVILAVPRVRVEDHHVTFETMLGSIRGRVYYNLVSWYRVLALLPGFAVNRRFMEQMMGVREPMPDEVLAGEPPVTGWGRVVDGVRLARSIVGLVTALVRLPRSIDRFYVRLDSALGAPTPLAEMRLDALTAHYRTLERQLLTRWDAPLVNDFFAMIFYGVLRTLSAKWLGEAGDGRGLHNDLLVGEGDIVSAEPARRLQAMARVVAADPALTTLLAERPLAEIQAAFAASPNRTFLDLYDAYLAKFSDRCLDELKLESPTLADDPLMLLRTLGQLAQRERAVSAASPTVIGTVPLTIRGGAGSAEVADSAPSPNVLGTVPVTNDVRAGAEARVAAALRGRPIRGVIFRWVMGQARARVRHRENLRFERTRVFGRVRRVFVEAGKRLAAEGLLTRADDVFYLQVDEVLGVVEGTASTAALAALADVRRREYDAYRALPAPADRFETRGAVWVGNRFQASPSSAAAGTPGADAALGDDARRGIGCCPGVVEGVAHVIRDPRGATLAPGDILVAERTDPGWILLFPAASAVVVERGSVLSHSAIVARELGLPAVVSLPGLTAWLQTGDRIVVDGSTGIVRRLSRAEAASA